MYNTFFSCTEIDRNNKSTACVFSEMFYLHLTQVLFFLLALILTIFNIYDRFFTYKVKD